MHCINITVFDKRTLVPVMLTDSITVYKSVAAKKMIFRKRRDAIWVHVWSFRMYKLT